MKWSSGFAYCVGLIATDGCLYSDGKCLCFTSKDLSLVKVFKNLMKLHAKIGVTVSGQTGNIASRIQWIDRDLYKDLVSIGITSNKSKTIGKLLIPNIFFFDFLRGVFDGDGSFYSYHDKRFGTFLWYLTFNSASEKHILWLRKELKKRLHVYGHISKAKKSSVYSLRYGKKEGLHIINKMYYSSQVPCLKRKFQKIKNAQVVKLVYTHP